MGRGKKKMTTEEGSTKTKRAERISRACKGNPQLQLQHASCSLQGRGLGGPLQRGRNFWWEEQGRGGEWVVGTEMEYSWRLGARYGYEVPRECLITRDLLLATH